MADQVPAFPPVQIHVYPDTSGEAKVSGQVTPIAPTGDLTETMRQLIGVAAATAHKLGRPVRVTAIDIEGTPSVLAIDPDAGVREL